MDMKNLAVKAAALRVLADVIAGEQKQVRTELDAQMEATGASRVEASLPDGTKVATASRTIPKAKPHVVDEDIFAGWVREHSPSNVTTRVVRQVRPAYRRKLLTEMEQAGAAQVTDTSTGLIHDVPGVEMREPGAASHSLRPVDGAEEAIAEAWRIRKLAHLGLPELTTGGGETP